MPPKTKPKRKRTRKLRGPTVGCTNLGTGKVVQRELKTGPSYIDPGPGRLSEFDERQQLLDGAESSCQQVLEDKVYDTGEAGIASKPSKTSCEQLSDAGYGERNTIIRVYAWQCDFLQINVEKHGKP